MFEQVEVEVGNVIMQSLELLLFEFIITDQLEMDI